MRVPDFPNTARIAADRAVSLAAVYALLAMVILSPGAVATRSSRSEGSSTGVVEKEACNSKQTCSSCIQTPGCVWCSQPDDHSAVSSPPTTRCRAYEDGGSVGARFLAGDWCPYDHIVWPNSTSEIIEDIPLRRSSQGHQPDTDAVQLRPQKVKLKLRVGEPYSIKMQYSQAEDYPVDLYFLMDLSASMHDDKETLSSLGDQLALEMSKLTSNFRLGFGSFVDKVAMPFVSTTPEKLKSPCEIEGQPCDPPYGFKNHMPLTLDTALFKGEVKRTKVSGNLDSPEGGLDALMQVIVCHKEIGWRMKARHLIVFSTDALFHLAGDGKLAGVVEPNDGLCHLNEKMEYTHGLMLDYPSISQINAKAQEHNMNIIFAVVRSKKPQYEILSHRIKGASCGQLSKGSSNVVKLVRDQYAKLVDSVTLTDNAKSYIRVQYFSSCLDNTIEERETKECGGIRLGNVINFTAYITVLKCPEDEHDRHVRFQIKPQSLNESMEVELEIICDCPCELPGHSGYSERSELCSGHGTLKCGDCACSEDFVGKKCQCLKGVLKGASPDNITDCVPEGKVDDPTAVICSNVGSCECGVCVCDERPNDEKISGKYCECDNFSCKREEGKVCSGPDHGNCVCGECHCISGWAGETCDCRNVTDTCIQPGTTGSDQICSGKGDCICGNCHCHSKHHGLYCEVCPTCIAHCEELKNCVECQAFSSSDDTVLDEKECIKCPFTVQKVDSLMKALNSTVDESQNLGKVGSEEKYVIGDEGEDDDDEDEEGRGPLCGFPDNAGCTFFFDYKYKDGKPIVRVQREKVCGSSEQVLTIVLAVVGSIVLAGLILLLVWKLLTHIHDHREYERFETERQMSKWGQGINPLYQQATTNFENPTFGK